MEKFYKNILWATIIPLSIVAALTISYLIKQRHKSYNFNRKTIEFLDGPKSIDIGSNAYSFAGKYKDSLYLASSFSPGHLLKIESNSLDSHTLSISVNPDDVKNNSIYKSIVDSNRLFLTNGSGAQLLAGDVRIRRIKPIRSSFPFFLQIIPLETNSFIFQVINSKTGNRTIRKQSNLAENLENPKLLVKQVDGIFCTDGTLLYNKQLAKLIYIYRYRNEILVIDTNINLVKKIRTIDPIARAELKVGLIPSNNSRTLLSDPLLVNEFATYRKKFLFVHSKIMSNAEEGLVFNTSSVIDVYDLIESKYVFSFYIPYFRHMPVRSFVIDDNFLWGIADRYLIRYTLRDPTLLR